MCLPLSTKKLLVILSTVTKDMGDSLIDNAMDNDGDEGNGADCIQ